MAIRRDRQVQDDAIAGSRRALDPNRNSSRRIVLPESGR